MVCLKIDSGLEISDLLARYPAHHKVEHSFSREEANNTFHERQLGKPSNRSQYLCIQNSRNKCFSVLSNNFSPTTLQAQDKVANMVVKGTRHSIGGSLRGRGMGVHWGRTVTLQLRLPLRQTSADLQPAMHGSKYFRVPPKLCRNICARFGGLSSPRCPAIYSNKRQTFQLMKIRTLFSGLSNREFEKQPFFLFFLSAQIEKWPQLSWKLSPVSLFTDLSS